MGGLIGNGEGVVVQLLPILIPISFLLGRMSDRKVIARSNLETHIADGGECSLKGESGGRVESERAGGRREERGYECIFFSFILAVPHGVDSSRCKGCS